MIDPARWPRLKELFFEVAEQSRAERAAYLERLAGDDRELAPTLAALLGAHDEESDGFERAAALARSEALAAAAPPVAGTRFGPWEIVAPIGRGGMGLVFQARRADGEFDQTVALKLVREAFAGPEGLERFRRERQMLAQLEHPGIARLIDGGTTPEGFPYLVLEPVDGVPIDEFCTSRALSIRSRVELFLGVCAAVDHAHRALVVHRDLKPSNILVTAAGEPKLLDFGIAKLLGAETDLAATPTRTVARWLTPEYASPEQVRGEVVTTATDVYSLGVLLFRLLAGANPYRFETERATEIERVICDLEPPKPSSVAAAGGVGAIAVRELAGDLDTIVLQALRKEPERRYLSAAALADDLSRYLDGLPVAARGSTFGYRSGKFVRRHRLAVAAAAIALLSLLAGTTLALWQASRATHERDLARAAATRATQLNELLRSILMSADPLRGEGRNVTVAALLGRASENLGFDLTGQPELEADLRETLGATYRNLGLAAEAEAEHRRALARLGDADGESEARLRTALAIDLRDQGKLDEAESELRRALDGLGPKPSSARAMALDGLGVVLRQRGRGEEAILAGRQALHLARQTTDQPLELANVVNDLALALGEHGELEEAEELHREAVARVRSARGERHPLLAMTLANLAGILDIQGRLADAEPLYREALEAQEELLGERHPDYLRTLTSYANLLWLAHRPAEAEAPARRAEALALAAFGGEHPLTAYARNILGGVLLDLGRPLEAEPTIRAALEARERQLGASHWLTASARSNLGAALTALGRRDEARRELERAYRDLLAERGPEHEKTRLTADRLAKLGG